MQSLKSRALEPTRTELARRSGGGRPRISPAGARRRVSGIDDDQARTRQRLGDGCGRARSRGRHIRHSAVRRRVLCGAAVQRRNAHRRNRSCRIFAKKPPLRDLGRREGIGAAQAKLAFYGRGAGSARPPISTASALAHVDVRGPSSKGKLAGVLSDKKRAARPAGVASVHEQPVRYFNSSPEVILTRRLFFACPDQIR
jgi:hypothetical protein